MNYSKYSDDEVEAARLYGWKLIKEYYDQNNLFPFDRIVGYSDQLRKTDRNDIEQELRFTNELVFGLLFYNPCTFREFESKIDSLINTGQIHVRNAVSWETGEFIHDYKQEFSKHCPIRTKKKREFRAGMFGYSTYDDSFSRQEINQFRKERYLPPFEVDSVLRKLHTVNKFKYYEPW